MSVKLMSAIFETEFRDLEYIKDGEERKAKASTCKLLLLAIADHANDYGESAYPGYDRLEIKTALSRQGIADTICALVNNGLLQVSDKPSRLQTNDYKINIDSFPSFFGESSHLTSTSQVTLLGSVKPLDLNHPLTTIEPSIGDKSPIDLPLDWKIANGQEITEADIHGETDRKMRDAANLISMGFGITQIEAYNLAYAFQVARQIVIPENKIKGQRKAVREMLEMKVRPGHVEQAVKDLTGKKMTVIDLYSVSKTAIDLANPAPGQFNPLERNSAGI